jgi:hypothetical protein
LLFKKDGEQSETSYQMENKGSCFEVTLKLSTGLYFYCFKLNDFKYIGLGENYEGVVTSSPVKFQLTVFDGEFSVPKWLKGGIIYQIFPDRFCSFNKNKSIDKGKILHDNWLDTPCFLPDEKGKIKNNDFFGGDIKGIISKLDYLSSLGVSAIYLNPIFKANSNHRYDTGDYMQIDPLLGNEADLKELIAKKDSKALIQIDGGVNNTNAKKLFEVGADSLVAGHYVFHSKDPLATIADLKKM